MERLRQRFPGVLTLAWDPPTGAVESATYGRRVRGRADLEIATDFVVHARGTEATPEERALLLDAFAAVRVDPEGAAA
jgi:exonuclease SbcD